MELVVPARISAAARDRVRWLACEAFTLAGCSGLARVDFFVDGDEVLLNELNTMPGQTPTSVYGKLWAAGGIEYPDLLERLCQVALDRHAAEREHTGSSPDGSGVPAAVGRACQRRDAARCRVPAAR